MEAPLKSSVINKYINNYLYSQEKYGAADDSKGYGAGNLEGQGNHAPAVKARHGAPPDGVC
jgi:hypothetical protein